MVVESADGVELLLRHSPSPTELDRSLAAQKENRRDGVLFVVARAGEALVKAASRDPRTLCGPARQSRLLPRRVAPCGGRAVRRAVRRPAAARADQLGATRRAAVVRAGRRRADVAVGDRTPDRWTTADRAGCWDRFTTEYPGPLGLASFWTATGEVLDQLERIEGAVEKSPNDGLALSGDVATTSTPLGGDPPESPPMSSCVLGTVFRSAPLWTVLSIRCAPRMYSSQRVVQHRYPPRSRWISSTFTAILAKSQQIRGSERFK